MMHFSPAGNQHFLSLLKQLIQTCCSPHSDVPSCIPLNTFHHNLKCNLIFITAITIKQLVNIYLFITFHKAIKDISLTAVHLTFRACHTITNRNMLKDITQRQMIPVSPPFHRPLSSTQAFTPNAKKHGLQRSFALIINQPHACAVEEEERND